MALTIKEGSQLVILLGGRERGRGGGGKRRDEEGGKVNTNPEKKLGVSYFILK